MITRKEKREAVEKIAKNARYEGPMTGFSMCAGCGICCKKNACACIPEDFEDLSIEGIEKILDGGKYMITAFYVHADMPGDIPIRAIPLITAREERCPKNGVNITMRHAKCAMLGEDGCMLSEDERPAQGLLLVPIGEGCRCLLTDPMGEWKEYWKVLDEVVQKRTGKTCQTLFEEELVPLATEIKRKVQIAVIYKKSITYQEYMIADAMSNLGVFYGLFGEELGDVMEDFVDWVDVIPVK